MQRASNKEKYPVFGRKQRKADALKRTNHQTETHTETNRSSTLWPTTVEQEKPYGHQALRDRRERNATRPSI